MKVRVIQKWAKHPETGQRVDIYYEMQQRDEDGNWNKIPVFDEEIDFPFTVENDPAGD